MQRKFHVSNLFFERLTSFKVRADESERLRELKEKAKLGFFESEQLRE